MENNGTHKSNNNVSKFKKWLLARNKTISTFVQPIPVEINEQRSSWSKKPPLALSRIIKRQEPNLPFRKRRPT